MAARDSSGPSSTYHALALLTALVLPPPVAEGAAPPTDKHRPPEKAAKNLPRDGVNDPWGEVKIPRMPLADAPLPVLPPQGVEMPARNGDVPGPVREQAEKKNIEPRPVDGKQAPMKRVDEQQQAEQPAAGPAESTGNGLGGRTTLFFTILGIAAALRGVLKGSMEALKWRSENRTSAQGCHLALPSLNEHIIDVRDGKLFMFIRSHEERPIDTLFGLRGYAKAFVEAAKRCTPENPFPPLHFEEFLNPKNTTVATGIPLPELAKYWFTPYPDLESMVKSYHRVLASFGSNELAPPGAAIRPVRGKASEYYEMVIIPIAEVQEGWSTLVLAAVHEREFARFGDPDFVERLKRDSPENIRRIDQLALAYAMEQTYQGPVKVESNGPGAKIQGGRLFPRTTVMSKSSRKKDVATATKRPIVIANGKDHGTSSELNGVEGLSTDAGTH